MEIPTPEIMEELAQMTWRMIELRKYGIINLDSEYLDAPNCYLSPYVMITEESFVGFCQKYNIPYTVKGYGKLGKLLVAMYNGVKYVAVKHED